MIDLTKLWNEATGFAINKLSEIGINISGFPAILLTIFSLIILFLLIYLLTKVGSKIAKIILIILCVIFVGLVIFFMIKGVL